MIKQLNPQFETMFLLTATPWSRTHKKDTIVELDTLGLDGQDFYNRYFHPVEQYYQVFSKNMVSSSGTALLHDMDIVILSICADAFREHPEWFTDLSNVPEAAVRNYIESSILSAPDSPHTDLLTALEAETMSDKAKWQLVVFIQKAKDYLTSIAEAVNLNIPAYEKAAAKVDKELKPLLEQFSQSTQIAQRLPKEVSPDTDIFPSLAFPTLLLVMGKTGFYGLLCDNIFASGDTDLTKSELLMCAKALSDKSKLEILLCLKGSSRFNLEIAELMGLTPATVSHHMNTLFAAGFVDMEKRDGKVFYKLATDGIKRYLAGIEQILL